MADDNWELIRQAGIRAREQAAAALVPDEPHPHRRLRGVIVARESAGDICIADCDEVLVRLTRREAQFLAMRLAEALIDAP